MCIRDRGSGRGSSRSYVVKSKNKSAKPVGTFSVDSNKNIVYNGKLYVKGEDLTPDGRRERAERVIYEGKTYYKW